MSDQPAYKSLKVTFTTWQTITRIAARTGEPRSTIVERLAREEEERLLAQNDSQNSSHPQTPPKEKR